MFTCKALANRLLALNNRFYKPSRAYSSATHCFSQNKFYYRISVLEQPVEMRFQAILTVGTYLISQTCFHCKNLLYSIVGSTCDVFICNTANGRNHYNAHSSTIFHYFDSIFYYFNAF